MNSLTYFIVGVLGIILHNLVDINRINRDPSKGNFNFKQYLKINWASIGISFIVVIISIIAKDEIKQLEYAGKWLLIGFAAIGYMAESLLTAVLGKANKIIGNDTEKQG